MIDSKQTFTLQINIEIDGKIHKIEYNEKDNIDNIALSFIKNNALQESLVGSLTQSIKNFMQTFKTRYDLKQKFEENLIEENVINDSCITKEGSIDKDPKNCVKNEIINGLGNRSSQFLKSSFFRNESKSQIKTTFPIEIPKNLPVKNDPKVESLKNTQNSKINKVSSKKCFSKKNIEKMKSNFSGKNNQKNQKVDIRNSSSSVFAQTIKIDTPKSSKLDEHLKKCEISQNELSVTKNLKNMQLDSNNSKFDEESHYNAIQPKICESFDDKTTNLKNKTNNSLKNSSCKKNKRKISKPRLTFSKDPKNPSKQQINLKSIENTLKPSQERKTVPKYWNKGPLPQTFVNNPIPLEQIPCKRPISSKDQSITTFLKEKLPNPDFLSAKNVPKKKLTSTDLNQRFYYNQINHQRERIKTLEKVKILEDLAKEETPLFRPLINYTSKLLTEVF